MAEEQRRNRQSRSDLRANRKPSAREGGGQGRPGGAAEARAVAAPRSATGVADAVAIGAATAVANAERRRRPRWRERRFDGPPDIELDKLIGDSLYLDNQAHIVVSRMRDMDSGTRSSCAASTTQCAAPPARRKTNVSTNL